MNPTEESLAQQFGKNVRRLRRKQGFSQKQFAELCSLHRSAINVIEQGQRLPRLNTLLKIMAVLDWQIDELLLGVPAWVPGPDRSGEWIGGSRRN